MESPLVEQTEVLIVGAGPTGLSLACQLVRYGVDFVILDLKEGVTPFSKAIGVQARTLEIYDQLDLAKAAVGEGAIAGQVRMLSGGKVVGKLELSKIGEGMSPFPFALILEQSKNERLLYEYLKRRGRDVCWNAELGLFGEFDAGITASLRGPDGRERPLRCRYLVGCDGAKSAVRHALGIGFEGSTMVRSFYVADAQIDGPLSHECLQVCFSRDAFLLFFPLKGEKRFRIVGVFPDEFAAEEGEVLYEDIERDVRRQSHLDLEIHDVEWFSTYRVHTRHAATFSSGRCFLAGDAAHIHSPAGAQGMNTGIQDAYNLAWKLGFVLRRGASESLLNTYNEERLENAKRLLQTTDRLFELGAGTEWFQAFIREHVFPVVGNTVLNMEAVKRFVFPLISQIGINYRNNSLSDHAGDHDLRVKAGDRMPYLLIRGESIYHHLRAPKFHLISFGEMLDAVDELPNEDVEIHSFPLTDAVRDAFGASAPFQALLRPDHYLAGLYPATGSERAMEYLGVHGFETRAGASFE
jgi:2-polyprenyl-6-methoxyphenol hydroxylase-like FAD-dependent oxidoreductase